MKKIYNKPMQMPENRMNKIIDILGSDERDVLLEKEAFTYEELRDTAISLELVDLEKALMLMKLARDRFPRAGWPPRKIGEYEKLLAVMAAGFVDIQGITLSINHHVSIPILIGLVAGYYEIDELILAKNHITSNDVVLELGAGLGFIASSVSPLCERYIAYEANPHLIPLIEETKRINDLNFEIHNGVILNENGETPFYVTPDFWTASLVKPETAHDEITVKTFNKNEVIKKTQPTTLIVDIEGGEYEFFEGLDFQSVKKIIVEIHPDVLSNIQLTAMYSCFIQNEFIMDFHNIKENVQYWYR